MRVRKSANMKFGTESMFHIDCAWANHGMAAAPERSSAFSLTFCQNTSSASMAPWRPSFRKPSVKTTPFMAPALVPLMPSMKMRPSRISRSSTPQVKAPCAPPPCSARLTRLRAVRRRKLIDIAARLLAGPAAIHGQGDARDGGRIVAAQEDRERAEMLGRREFQHGLLFREQHLLRLVDRDALLLGIVLDLLLH